MTKQRIAILGGGVGALSAAYGLTQVPGWQDRYEIAVHQMGWRLGGKGACSRNPQYGQRIEEHGLHEWFGFYENAFQVMRQIYTERGLDWRHAFAPHDDIVFAQQWHGRTVSWAVTLPTNPCEPGDGHALPSPWDFVVEAIRVLLWGDDSWQRRHAAPDAIGYPDEQDALAKAAALEFITTKLPAIWPKAFVIDDHGKPQFRWELLVDPEQRVGPARLDSQFWRANVDPSERYVLSIPGSSAQRLRADRSGFSNLYLAGDWTENGLNAGCMEAAFISGLQASRGICGSPSRIIGEFDGPVG